ncbi:MAG TPA: hypothetical protein PK367_02555 [Candidatus Paceibacterota bacterium]|nr:hypothetical protein [Candidatus Paceibacterota bacterium]
MDLVKKIIIIAAVAFFIFYLFGAISGSFASPQERRGPYVEYYR